MTILILQESSATVAFDSYNPTIALPIMEHFYTLQGEGYYQGQAAYFIRLAGCNVGCHWCDVKASWQANDHPILTISELVASASAQPARISVITGGEPLLYNLDTLCTTLRQKGFRTHLETSGAYPLSGVWDWVCLSPKKFKPPLPEVIKAACELKIVVYHKSDLEWAAWYAEQVSPHCKLYLQPEWSRSADMLPLMVAYVQENPQWALTLQMHKYMNIP